MAAASLNDPKTAARAAALGAVEELNAVIGVARLHSGQNDRIDAMLGRIQNDLLDLGVDLGNPAAPAPHILDSQVDRLTQEIDWMSESLKPLDGSILPGGAPLSAHLHLARAVARRAGREAIGLVEAGETVSDAAMRYMNRLSDHLFCAARRANANGAGDIKWKPGGTR